MAITRYEAATPVVGSLVTVYLAATQVLATIYADALLTPLANPFTSDALTGLYVFYADDAAAYDIQLNQSGIPTPPPSPTANSGFGTLNVFGSQAVVASQPADTMQFLAGAGIQLDGDSTLRTITITNEGGGGGSGLDQLTGDVTAGPGTGSQIATLAASGATAGTYGDSTHVAQVTVDAKGRITSVAEVAIAGSPGTGTVTNTGTLTASQLMVGTGGVDITALGSLGTNVQVLHGNAAGVPTWGSVVNADLATMAANTFKGNFTGSPATPTDGTVAQMVTALGLLEVPFAADAPLDFGKAYLDVQILTSAPAAPSAGYMRIYAIDSGGKVQWNVRFPSGAVQQVKIEV